MRHINLGLPKGFCYVTKSDTVTMRIMIWLNNTHPEWNLYNLPVWKMRSKKNPGVMFIRTYCPRVDISCVDVVYTEEENICPEALLVFEEDMFM